MNYSEVWGLTNRGQETENEMEFVGLVTVLLLLQYLVFMLGVGTARTRAGIEAPAVSGEETFERALRVQVNTMEQLVITLPAMWLSAMYFKPLLAAGLGLVFFLGRLLYRLGYMKAPAKRAPGMIIGFLANLGLMGTALWGLVSRI